MEDKQVVIMHDIEQEHWWFRAKDELLLSLINKAGYKSGAILDIGCGTGRLMAKLKVVCGPATNVVGLDASATAVRFAIQTNPGVKCEIGKADKTGFLDNTFALVIASDMLEHTEYDNKVLEEAWRVLAPGGLLVVTVPAFQFLWSIHDYVLSHLRRYTKGALVSRVKEQRFIILKTGYFFGLLFPAFVVSRLLEARVLKCKIVDDNKPVPALMNRLFYNVCRLERTILPMPVGSTIYCVARKK